jgi:hypothetical protein
MKRVQSASEGIERKDKRKDIILGGMRFKE